MSRSLIYDSLLPRLTSQWYREVLERVPDGASVLDVGIGTASALLANADRVEQKDLRITGIDIDADYIQRARKQLAESPVRDRVEARLESVDDHQGGPYDAVYFAASFMLLPDPVGALRHCTAMLAPGGRFYFTQTIHQRRVRWLEWLKPMLKHLTSADFGRVTYEDSFRNELARGGLELEEFTTLAAHGNQTYCLAVAKPEETA
jgi:ubiquinone/menaquinone biosynthesis C-methylase UbiE